MAHFHLHYYLNERSPYGNRCSELHCSTVQGPNESWLPIMDKAEFKAKDESHLYVEQFHHERVNDVHNIKQNFRESIERVVHQVCPWEPKSSIYPSILSARNKIEIAIEMRKSGARGYSYKTHKLLGDLSCQILQVRDFYIDPTSDELYLEDNDGKVGHHLQKVTSHEIVFGPSGENNRRYKAMGLPTRSLWFNVPASALRDTLPKGKRHTSSLPEALPYQSILRPFELNTFLQDEAHDLETEVLEFTLDQLKLHGYISDNTGYYELMNKIDILQAFVQRWAWPVSSDRVAHVLSPDTMEPAIDSSYQVNARDCENRALEKIWSSFIKVLSHDDLWGESKMVSTYMMMSSENDDNIVQNLSSSFEKDEALKLAQGTRSERCWKSLLLPNTNSNGRNDWELIRNEVGVVY